MAGQIINGERVPPVHKPWKESQCVWVSGIGWVRKPANGQKID